MALKKGMYHRQVLHSEFISSTCYILRIVMAPKLILVENLLNHSFIGFVCAAPFWEIFFEIAHTNWTLNLLTLLRTKFKLEQIISNSSFWLSDLHKNVNKHFSLATVIFISKHSRRLGATRKSILQWKASLRRFW